MVDGWVESKASLVIQNVILLFIKLLAFGAGIQKPRRKRRVASFLTVAKPIAAQKSLVDRDRRLRPFRDGYRDKKNVARHITRNIYTGNTGFFRIGVVTTPPFALRWHPRRLERSDA